MSDSEPSQGRSENSPRDPTLRGEELRVRGSRIGSQSSQPFSWRTLFVAASHEQETLRYVLVSSLDFFMTYIMLRSNPKFVEANVVARFFLYGWGVKGLIYFKLGMVALVCVISQIVAHKRPRVAKWLLNWATVVVAGVVIYSLVLFLRHSDVSELLETW